MAKSIKVNQKKRGRPATGRDPVSAVRLPAALTVAVDRWAKEHEANRSEAIRRLVELGLAKEPARPAGKPGRRTRARELAVTAIEKMIDPSALRARRNFVKTASISRKRRNRVSEHYRLAGFARLSLR
jgi:Arc/MetJ-type ribon-helix-helix transcriptional regulator